MIDFIHLANKNRIYEKRKGKRSFQSFVFEGFTFRLTKINEMGSSIMIRKSVSDILLVSGKFYASNIEVSRI